jgi:hypothetical protein
MLDSLGQYLRPRLSPSGRTFIPFTEAVQRKFDLPAFDFRPYPSVDLTDRGARIPGDILEGDRFFWSRSGGCGFAFSVSEQGILSLPESFQAAPPMRHSLLSAQNASNLLDYSSGQDDRLNWLLKLSMHRYPPDPVLPPACDEPWR